MIIAILNEWYNIGFDRQVYHVEGPCPWIGILLWSIAWVPTLALSMPDSLVLVLASMLVLLPIEDDVAITNSKA